MSLAFILPILTLTPLVRPNPFQFSSLSARVPNPCNTLDGTLCVFPFSYKDQTYYQCTYTDSPTPWCATMVGPNNNVVTNRWGDCESGPLSSCQAELINIPSCTATGGPGAGQACIFPFRHQGITYSECTTDPEGTDLGMTDAWCSIDTTEAGEHISGSYGNCPSTCPGAPTTSTTTSTATSSTTASDTTTTATTTFTTTTVSTTSTTTSSTSTTTTSTTTTSASTTTSSTSTTTTLTTTTTVSTTTASSKASRTKSSCPVVSGPAAGRNCVFPFTFFGVTFTSCGEWVFGGPHQGEGWCSTKVDNGGVHIDGEGNFGFCAPECGRWEGLGPRGRKVNQPPTLPNYARAPDSVRDAVSFGK